MTARLNTDYYGLPDASQATASIKSNSAEMNRSNKPISELLKNIARLGIVGFWPLYASKYSTENNSDLTITINGLNEERCAITQPYEITEKTAVPCISTFNLSKYLNSLCQNERITESVFQRTLQIWKLLRAEIGSSIADPDAAPLPDRGIVLAFDDGQKHIEFEIREGNPVEFFYFDRVTNDSDELVIDEQCITVPQTVISKLKLLSK